MFEGYFFPRKEFKWTQKFGRTFSDLEFMSAFPAATGLFWRTTPIILVTADKPVNA